MRCCPSTLTDFGGGYDGFILNDDEGEYISISHYEGDETDIVIPEEFDGIPVKELDAYAFAHIKKTESIVIPSGVKDINLLFHGRTPNLRNIEFKGRDISIILTFDKYNITSIEELVLPASYAGIHIPQTLRKLTFTNSSGLTIPSGAFYRSDALEEVVFDDVASVDINQRAFSGLSALKNVTFTENCGDVAIGSDGFKSSGVESIDLKSKCCIENSAFEDAAALKTVTFEDYADLKFYAFKDCTALEEVRFGGDLSLESGAFKDCTALTDIYLDTSKPINGSAFNGCSNLQRINGKEVFDDETGELAPEFADYVRKYFTNADNVGFLNKYINAELKKIVSENVTDDMTDMEKVRILHDWVCEHTVYDYDDPGNFSNHTDASILMSGSSVCDGYARMCNLLFHEAGIETYCVQNFEHIWNIVKVDDCYFHLDATWDDGDVISRNWMLRSDEELRTAGGAHNVWEIFRPSGLHSFQGDVLPECTSIMGDVNGDGEVSSEDAEALSAYLSGDSSLIKCSLVTADLTYDGRVDEADLAKLQEITDAKKVTETNANFEYRIRQDGSVSIVSYIGSSPEAVIPEEIDGRAVGEVERNAFVSALHVESIAFPVSVNNIALDLDKNEKLSSMTLAGKDYHFSTDLSHTSIEEMTFATRHIHSGFAGSKSLRKVSFTNAQNLCIDKDAFMNCTALEEVSFDTSKVITIGENAFAGCTSLNALDFTLKPDEAVVGKNAFAGSGVKEVVFKIPATVDDSAFEGCDRLQSAAFNEDIVIGDRAFRDCTALEEITFKTNAYIEKSEC